MFVELTLGLSAFMSGATYLLLSTVIIPPLNLLSPRSPNCQCPLHLPAASYSLPRLVRRQSL